MRFALYVLTVGGGTLVQCVLGPAVSIDGVAPDIPVVLVVLLAIRRGPEAGCLVGFALGLVADVLAGGPLGLHALSKALVGSRRGVSRAGFSCPPRSSPGPPPRWPPPPPGWARLVSSNPSTIPGPSRKA